MVWWADQGSGSWLNHKEGSLVQGMYLHSKLPNTGRIWEASDLWASHFQKTYNLIQRKISSFSLLILANFLLCCVFLPQTLVGTHLWPKLRSNSSVSEGLSHLLPEQSRKPSFIKCLSWTNSTLKYSNFFHVCMLYIFFCCRAALFLSTSLFSFPQKGFQLNSECKMLGNSNRLRPSA